MEFVINEPKKIKVQFLGESYEVRQPTLGDQKDLQEALEEAKNAGKSPFEPMILWAEKLGLPREVVLKLPQDGFQQLVEHLSDSKKK